MRYVFTYSLLLCVMLLFAACGGGSSDFEADTRLSGAPMEIGVDTPITFPPLDDRSVSAYSDSNPDWEWDLIAGQNMLAGTVKVWNDTDTLFVEYSLFGDWMMDEAHVGVWDVQPGPKDGKPGRFDNKEEFDPAVNYWLFEISLDNFADKSALFIATHAATTNGETIWGGDWNGGDTSYDFEWKKWGGGFSTNVMPSYELPAFGYTSTAYHWGTESYWDITLNPDSNFPFPGSNDWVGWCSDPRSLTPGAEKDVTLYSCYDPNLPAYAQSDNWDLISYMMTMRNEGTGVYDQNWANNTWRQAFQDAVWYFKYGPGTKDTTNWRALLFINDAIDNGEEFIPGPGEYFAVILWPGLNSNGVTKFQMNIIEVDP